MEDRQIYPRKISTKINKTPGIKQLLLNKETDISVLLFFFFEADFIFTFMFLVVNIVSLHYKTLTAT